MKSTIDHESSKLIQARLNGNGAPQTSGEDISRLNKGPLGDALLFLSEHIRGRQATLEARKVIAIVQAHNSLTGATLSESQRLKKRVRSANAEVEQHYEQFYRSRQSVGNAQKDVDVFETTLQSQRQVALLLSVMHRKEQIRVDRIAALIHGLEAARLIRQSTISAPTTIMSSQGMPLRPLIRVDATRDTLAAIQAIYLYTSTAQLNKCTAAENGLRTAIARKLNLPEDDEQVQVKVHCVVRSSRQHASSNLQIQANDSDDVNDSAFKAAVAKVDAKENRARKTVEQLAYLQASCTESLQAISIYREASVPTLKESLEDDLKAAQDYVDTLRSSIELRLPREAATQCAQPNIAIPFVENKLRNDVLEAHDLQAFIHSAKIERRSIDPQIIDAAIRTFTTIDNDANSKALELLHRKNAKKESVGDVLVQDIERLETEVELLVHGSL
ncbi:hypothetical protein EUX98_g7176 [Antrodiella citrinella]|uniref:Uncharacterized protein n=1 Tax=Antrodiella citrinella TaxID=2447956 RepID=A0A4S4MPN1_9APHY|nr:hypothetical protein EUX98_g7176 [Antrodiella citrinella]